MIQLIASVMEKINLDFFLTVLATLATLAAAVAACMSYKTARASFSFTKKYAKNYGILIALESVQKKLLTLKMRVNNLLGITSEEFESLEPMFLEIKLDLEKLIESKVLKEKSSSIKALSFDDFISKSSVSVIESEIKLIQKAIDEIFH